MSAYEVNSSTIEGMGTVDFIVKPIPPELLRSKVGAFTSLHRRGEELRRRGDALAAKDRDIAMLAHDLRNPLAAINTAANVLLRANLDPHSQNCVERISRGVGRMSEMIRNLTDYARAGRGAIPIAPEAMDLGLLCQEIVEDFRNADPRRQIDLSLKGSLEGAWDRTRLYQVLSNLLANAIRHGAGDIVVRAQDKDSQVEIAVHNAGPPIPAELVPVIFEPFERGTRDQAGLGLGLYIVREIAEAHRGEVFMTSSIEMGTTFVLLLPRQR